MLMILLLLTTINNEDQPIVDLCEKIDCSYLRGSEEDVLSRVLGAAKSVDGDIIVEIIGDCPLVDHRHINRMIEHFYSGEYDYANMKKFPNGFGVQVFPTEVLDRVDKLTDDPIDRVHVSYYIYTHLETFRLFHWGAEGDMNWPEGRVTLDEQSDYELLNAIVEELYPKNEDFSAEDIVRLLKSRPDLVAINAEVRQKEIQEG